MINFSENFKRYRREAGINQDELASRMGVTPQAVSKWECGLSMPDVMLLVPLAELFGITVDELLRGEGTAEKVEVAVAETKPSSEHSAELCDENDILRDDDVVRIVRCIGRKVLAADELSDVRIPLEFKETKDTTVNVEVYGNVDGDINANGCVTCGSVVGNVDANGSVICGSVGTHVDANGCVTCGIVGTHVDASGNVTCGSVGAHVDASGNITCGSVGAYVDAGGNVACGSVGAHIDAGGDVKCGRVTGDVDAGGDVNCGDIDGDVTANNVTCKHIEGDVEAETVNYVN